ncbi:hypothetical protein Mal65_15710 [Crateriforma conspicua]|nr:hypothetical protein Mal65_15710 [Crateriforma conspicua]
MLAEATRSLAICSDFSERRCRSLNGKLRFILVAIAAGESVCTLVVSAGYKNVANPNISGFARESAVRMAAIVHPLLTLLASLTRQELAQQVTYLKAENAILRSKLPYRITLNNQERRRLVRHGKKLGPRIKELISIVSYSTFRRWIRNMEDGPAKRPKSKVDDKPGRPRIDESIADTIIRIRKETGWVECPHFLIHGYESTGWLNDSTVGCFREGSAANEAEVAHCEAKSAGAIPPMPLCGRRWLYV